MAIHPKRLRERGLFRHDRYRGGQAIALAEGRVDFLMGFVPALKAYRTALHDGLAVRVSQPVGEYGGYRVQARNESSGGWIIRRCSYSEEWIIESREWLIERRFPIPGPGWHQHTLREARRYASDASRDGLDRRVIVVWGFEDESGEGLESLWRRGVEVSWEEQQRAIKAARKEAAQNRERAKHFRAAVRQS